MTLPSAAESEWQGKNGGGGEMIAERQMERTTGFEPATLTLAR
jgi:hypothetical protein